MRTDQLSALVTNKFPYPLAHAFRGTVDESDSRAAFCNLLETTIHYLSQVLICDYLSRDDRDAKLNERLARILDRPPTMGMWLDWALRILEIYQKQSREPLIPVLGRLMGRASRRDLYRLVDTRNRLAHRGQKFKLGPFRRALLDLLQRIETLHKSPLFCLKSARIDGQFHIYKAALLRGDNPNFGQIECRSSHALETDKVYVYENRSRELLSLYPLIVYGSCRQCEENHCFQFLEARGRKVVYSSVRGGHELESGEAFQFFKQLFRRSTSARVRPRHFSMPGEFAGLPRVLKSGDAVGPYSVDELIKIGGMSHVYRVKDTRNGESYALKLLPVELSRDTVLLTRFEDEAQKIGALDHPNVVSLHDFGEDFGDRYIILDLALGGTIGNQKVRDLNELRKPIAEELIIKIGRQICEGLQHVHTHGIVHRDLKPGNVLVTGARVEISDFGISKARGDAPITLTGLPVGTPEYMSPEQIEQNEVDPRTDLYALGCMLYEFAVGRPPYRAETPLTTAIYHLQATPPRIEDLNPRISEGLRNIIYKALQKDPDGRYQSARAFFDDLGAVAKNPAGRQVIEGQKTPQDSREEERARDSARFRRRLLTSSLTFLALLVVFFGAKKLYENRIKDDQIHSLVGDARRAWEEGPDLRENNLDPWAKACEFLQKARAIDSYHDQVTSLRRDMFTQGSLIVRAEDATLRLEIEADTDTDERLELNLSPRVLETEKSTFRPDELIRLSRGHYRVRIVDHQVSFPIFVSQVRYEYTPEGWKRVERLKSEEIIEPEEIVAQDSEGKRDSERKQGPESILLAEQFVIDNLVLPEKVPEDFRFVNPGPFFGSKPNLDLPKEVNTDPEQIVTLQADVVPDSLKNGFLVKRGEVTVFEFERWFKALGSDYCRWRMGQAPLLNNTTNLEKLKASVRHVPLEVQKRCWADELNERELDPNVITSTDALLEMIYADEAEEWEDAWIAYEKKMRSRLSTVRDKNLPVRRVDRQIALAFARTHAPVVASKFRAWLNSRVGDSQNLVGRLRKLIEHLDQAQGDRLDYSENEVDFDIGNRVNAENLGGRGRRGGILLKFEPTWVFQAYVDSLKYDVFYAHQIPVQAIVAWLGEDEREDIRGFLDDELNRFIDLLQKPEQWLLVISEKGPAVFRKVILSFVRDVSKKKVVNIKSHFKEWLGRKTEEEEERLGLFRDLLESSRAWQGTEKLEEGEPWAIPWEVRLEYGWDLGWDLPTSRQWEKAFRGADSRIYPWGYRVRLNVFPAPPKLLSVPVVESTGDRSPHGVSGLGGGVSEWVIEDFRTPLGTGILRGGNSRFLLSLGSACYFLSNTEVQRLWAGFRVVREIRPARSRERSE